MHASLSSQSASSAQQPWMDSFEHRPSAPHTSVVHASVSSHEPSSQQPESSTAQVPSSVQTPMVQARLSSSGQSLSSLQQFSMAVWLHWPSSSQLSRVQESPSSQASVSSGVPHSEVTESQAGSAHEA